MGDGLDGYADSHDVPADPDSTSGLSPRLRFGELSPRQLLAAALDIPEVRDDDRQAWIRQRYWRELAAQPRLLAPLRDALDAGPVTLVPLVSFNAAAASSR